MQLPHHCQAIGDPASRQDPAVLVEQAQVMVVLAPVHPDKQHGVLLCSDFPLVELEKDLRRPNGAVLTWHDIPPAVRPLNTGRGAVASHRRLVRPH